MQLTTLSGWIDDQKTEAEAFLKHLVEINTFTANEAGVDKGMDVLSEFVQQRGFTVEAINGRHRLIKAGDGTSKPRLLLISHMDTVFPPDGDFLNYEPLENGFVRGPGTGDIKGGMVIGLWSMLALREMVDQFDVQMIVSANEEKGSPTIRDWYMGGHVGADYAIGLEPGFPQGKLTPEVDLGVVYQRRGYCAFNFTITGKKSHSGVAHQGLNAIEAAAQRITRLHALTNHDKGISVTVGIINGGTAANTVPGEVTGTVSCRFETTADGEATKASIIKILTDSYMHNEEYDVRDSATYEEIAYLPPMEKSDSNQKLVDLVLQEAQRLNQNVVPIARGGGSDANFVSGSGTPAICGMGAPTHGLHTEEEMIYLPGLFNRIELLTSVLYHLVTE